MVVQQGQLSATDANTSMENFYSDAVVDTITDVDRIIHNGTQFVRLVLQRPQAVTGAAGASSAPDILTTTPHYIDGQFTSNATSGVNLIRIGFANGQQIATTKITLYSSTAIDTVAGNWEIATSFNGLDSEFTLSNFKATSLSIAETPVTLDSLSQFKYELSFIAPAIGGLTYWRVTHTGSTAFDSVTEMEVVEPLTPTLSYFNTGGTFASSSPFAKSRILDAAYDNINNVFYTIRFNSDSVGSSNITIDDDFGDADAGTASGTNNFNTGRWLESATNSAFLRLADQLSYNTAAGKGQLETTFTLDNFQATIDVLPQTLTTENMWFAIRALDSDNKVLIQEGVGLETSPTSSGVYFASSVDSFVDSVGTADLKELRPLWHNTSSGTDSFTITFNGSDWAVTGTQTGLLATNATTGVLYNESVESTTPIEFLISADSTPSNGENFTFDLKTENIKRDPLATGTLQLARTGSNFTTGSVFQIPETINDDNVTIELYGSTNGTVDVKADNFAIVGSGTFPGVAVFTVERTDNDGNLDSGNPIVIESLDVIGNPSLTYNDFLDGKVQIAATASGSGGGNIYLKINNTLYKYPNGVSLTGLNDGSGATESTVGQIATEGTHSFAWTHRSTTGGIPFLTYIEYDSDLDIVHLRTLDKDNLIDTTNTKELLLDIPNYTAAQELRVFYDQNDFDTLRFVDTDDALKSWNIDDRISAFMAVNAEDVTLPAGTAQQTFVNADVINAWGEVLAGKTVTFTITAGDGAISPSTDSTDVTGRATSQFVVGSTVGTSTITATVTET